MLLDVVLEHAERSSSDPSRKIARGPSHCSALFDRPECLDARKFPLEPPRRHTLQAVDQLGYADLRRIADEQVDVIAKWT